MKTCILYCLITLLVLLPALPAPSQQQPPLFDVTGVLQDEQRAVFPGLPLRFTRAGTDLAIITDMTDMNGRFSAQLGEGDYVLTSPLLDLHDLRVFLKLGPNGLNPGFFTLTSDWSKVACMNDLPPVLKSATPAYPPAARAVRVAGEAVVRVRIQKDGMVLSAEATSGHPLFRSVSKVAAQTFVFESTEQTDIRETEVTFVFYPSDSAKAGLIRKGCSARIFIPAFGHPIDITETRADIRKTGL